MRHVCSPVSRFSRNIAGKALNLALLSGLRTHTGSDQYQTPSKKNVLVQRPVGRLQGTGHRVVISAERRYPDDPPHGFLDSGSRVGMTTLSRCAET